MLNCEFGTRNFVSVDNQILCEPVGSGAGCGLPCGQLRQVHTWHVCQPLPE